MSKLRNNVFLSFFIIALILTGAVSSIHAAAFAPALSIPAGAGPSSIAVSSFTGTCSSNQSGLVALWSGENNANDSIGTQHGTLVNGTAFAAGMIGQAFSLDGADDYVQVPDSSTLDIEGQISLSAWIYPTALGGRIINKITAGGNDGYMLDTFGGKVRFIATSSSFASGRTSLPLNTWTHVAGVFDGTRLRVYVNGQLDGIAVVTGTIPTNSLPLRIGADSNAASLFSGRIDEVAIFNRALTAAEIRNLYQYACPTLTPDVAVANFKDNTVTVMLGNGDGTFTAAAGSPIAVGTAPYAVISGDFDRDGNIDLAVANSGDNTVSVLLGNGDGTFAPATGSPFAVGTTPYSLTSGDLDGDGFVDLAVANHKSGSISILVGDGHGVFAPSSPAVFSVGSSPAAIVAADFNTDEVEVKDELAVADSKNHNITILSLKNTLGTYTMTTAKKYTVGTTPLSLVTGDFNGDGLPDLAVANANSKNISVLLGLGTNLLTNPVHYKVIAFPSSITAADLDGDGRLDLAVTHLKGNTLSVLYGSGNGTFLKPITFTVGNHPLAVAAGDFDADGHNDLLTANYDANTLSLLINTPNANINVTSPAAGEHIATGSPFLITWTAYPGAVNRYVINYSSNNGSSFKKLAEVGGLQTTYVWNVPIPTANLNDNIIKVVAYDASNKILTEGSSKASFSIDAVAITQPNGGETFIGGQTKTIDWNTYATSKPATSVNLYYSIDAGSNWKQIDTITGNPGTYATWTVPTVKADEHDVLVKIELRAGSSIVASDVSDKFFTILITP